MKNRKEKQLNDNEITPTEFLAWRSPRRGTSNPTQQNNPVWVWLFHTKLNAFLANEQFKGPCPFVAGPGWSNERFGQTTTYLPDGRTIYIAGEHEDSYDPDFYIYNDVIVKHPDGELDFYGYPTEVFQPTDFHTATLAGNHIWVIGNLGYMEERQAQNTTPIYRLDINTLKIERILATGDAPVSICKHSAAYLPALQTIQIMSGEVWQGNQCDKNDTVWHLSLSDLRWIKKHQQQRINFQCRREDNKYMELDSLRFLAQSIAEHQLADIERIQPQIHKSLGHDFNLDMLATLYDFPFDIEPLQYYESGSDFYWTIIDGVKVTFEEDLDALIVHTEDQISNRNLALLKKHLIRVLSKLHGKLFVIDCV